jgi:hypothetical protein
MRTAPPSTKPGAPSRIWSTLAGVNVVVVVVAVVGSFVAILVPGLRVLEMVIGVMVLVGCVVAWPRLTRLVRLCTAGSLMAGIVSAVLVDARLTDIAAGLTQMAVLFAFLVLVRLLEVPILKGGYNRAFAAAVSTSGRVRRRATAGTLVTFGLSSGLSVGAVPIAFRSVEALWDGGKAEDMPPVVKVVTRGFTAGNSWTPVSPPVAVSLQTSGAALLPFVVWALPLALLMVATTIYGLRDSGSLEHTPSAERTRNVGEFAAFVVALMVAITAMQATLDISPIGASMLCIVALVVVWQSLVEGLRKGVRSLVRSFGDQRAGWPEQFALFCSGGVLVGAAQAFSRTGNLGALSHNTLLILLLVPVVMVVLALLSMYPLVTLAAFGTLLGPQIGGEATLPLALSLLIGTNIAFMISPFSGLTLLVGGMSGRSPADVGLRWNFVYAIWALVFGTAAIAAAYVVR